MARKSTSQWEFGELFTPQQTRQVLTISQLTANIRKLLENQIGTIWVGGEVSNLRLQSSGHAYFTLKDPGAQLNCVLFRGTTFAGRSLLDNGAKVIAHGDLSVYEPRGQYQLVVRELEFQGAGALQLAFEKLKRELEARGYFARERKRALPRFPERIGVVSSPTGAALRDVIHVVRRRHPGLEIVLAPCRVQGEGAATEIAAAIGDLNRWSNLQPEGRGLDALLVTRGGGSLEDLWAFNEPAVAEAIFQSALPVLSAVGHEIDFTISDFVADVRAATPSAAAEILTEGMHSSRRVIVESLRSLSAITRRGLSATGESLHHLAQRLRRCEPSRMIRDRMQYLDEIAVRLARLAANHLRVPRQLLAATLQRLFRVQPAAAILHSRETANAAALALQQVFSARLREKEISLNTVRARLQLLSPRQTLSRGYSITTDEAGRLLRSAKSVGAGDRLITRLGDGSIRSEVLEGQPPTAGEP